MTVSTTHSVSTAFPKGIHYGVLIKWAALFRGSMSTYHLRVSFRIQPDSFLDHEASTFNIRSSFGGGNYALSAFDGSSIKGAQWLVLKSTGEGFSTKDQAVYAGRRAKNAIAWSSAQMRVGVDLGDDKPHGGTSEYLKKRA